MSSLALSQWQLVEIDVAAGDDDADALAGEGVAFFRMVASGTAELGSITIFMRAQIRRMASVISCSEARRTSVT
jgi:hypothetical protein